MPGNTHVNCGYGGATCVACDPTTQHCENHQCVDACDGGLCPTGCCNGVTCEPGTANAACGLAGMACLACDAGQECVGQQCVTTISNGTFVMGSPVDEPGRGTDEDQHQVTLTHGFYMPIYPTMQGQFAGIAGWNPSIFSACGSDCPVDSVSWYDAVAYANLLSSAAGYSPCYTFNNVICQDDTNAGVSYMACENRTQGGILSATVTLNGVTSVYDCQGYRLPTEAEFEYATRAGTTTAFYDGPCTYGDACSPVDPNLTLIGWYCGNDNTTTEKVGLKLPNAWGLYDMTGNVTEWVWDWYGPYDAGPDTDPEGAAAGANRVNRGGSWNNDSGDCRSASRSSDLPGYNGFRVVMTAP
jgi:formylglycine-generating enzyme required for sulfatase activity